MAPKIRGTRIVHDGWARFLVADLVLPDGAKHAREIEDHGSAACVLPYDPGRRTALLVRQFRAPLFFADGTTDLLEAPAGLIDESDPEVAARREALEEAGVRLGALERVAQAWSMPGISTERMHLFLAAYAATDCVGPGGGLAAEGEVVAVEEVPLADLAAMSDRGDLTDVKTLLLVLALRLRRPDLFGSA